MECKSWLKDSTWSMKPWAIFDEHDPDCMRSSKVRREIENVLKCYKEVYEQKMKAATQVSIMKFFKKYPKQIGLHFIF